jgi:hypothetical protein
MLCGKARFEPRTLGTKAESYDHCATRQVAKSLKIHLGLPRRVPIRPVAGPCGGAIQRSRQPPS